MIIEKYCLIVLFLGWLLARTPEPWVISPEDQHAARLTPPADTRAAARSNLMHALAHETFRFFVDWEVIEAEGADSLHLLNPFEAKAPDPAAWLRRAKRDGLGH